MDYFKKYLGGENEATQSDGSNTVNKLVERARTSTLLDDRRGAVRALKSLSKGKFRLQVGSQGMDVLVEILDKDRSDIEIVSFALGALANIMSEEVDEEEVSIPADIGAQFTEIFIKNDNNIALLLSLLDEYDFHVRKPAVNLITTLLINKLKAVQEMILVAPQGVPRLMDLLSDNREFVRNDAILLLIQLTKGNTNIQKIVAFENAFQGILDIVASEGLSDGGVVVEDCLILLLNLLSDNKSNQTLFVEGGFVRYLTNFFDINTLNSDDSGWPAQKVANVHCMLQTVRALVSPSISQKERGVCQKRMNQSGLLEQLCSILMATGIPADVLTECINTVAEVIRGHPDNQNYFASVMAPSNPPQPAIVVLLMSMVNDKQPFVLRCAVLYCFECFLYKNELGQSQIIATLLPTSTEVNQITAGQLLCSGLFSTDALSTWFASVALLHTVLGKPTNKENLLRVQLATSVGSPPVTLLQQCMNILSQGSPHLQTKFGLLMFLITWLVNCPTVVSAFLSNPSNVSYLTSQVSTHDSDECELMVQGLCAFLLGVCVEYNKDDNPQFDKQSIRSIIDKRIGFEVYADRLSQASKSETYSQAVKKPYITAKDSSQVFFDNEFTKVYKSLEVQLLNSITKGDEDKERVANHDNIVTQYKELIRVQDSELAELRQKLSPFESMSSELESLRQQVQDLRDQNSLLKAQKGGGVQMNGIDSSSHSPSPELEQLNSVIKEKDTEIAQLNSQIESLKLTSSSPTPLPTSDSSAVISQLEAKHQQVVTQLETTLSTTQTELNTLREELVAAKTLSDQLKTDADVANRAAETANQAAEAAKSKVAKVEEALKEKETESEDLLLLLETNSEKVKELKTRLKTLGEQVSEDEEEEDDDEDEDGD